MSKISPKRVEGGVGKRARGCKGGTGLTLRMFGEKMIEIDIRFLGRGSC